MQNSLLTNQNQATMKLSNTLLADQIWQPHLSGAAAVARKVALSVAALALLIISGKLSVFTAAGVPFTMQTYAIVLLPMIMGGSVAMAAMLSYLGLALLGAPVLAGGGGVAYVLGPTGGFLLGFVIATAALAHLARKGWDKSLLRALLAMSLGLVIIFACGFAWLSTLIGPAKAWAFGVLPFIAGDILKIALAAVSLNLFWRADKAWRSR